MTFCRCSQTKSNKRWLLFFKLVLVIVSSLIVAFAVSLQIVLPRDSGFEDAITNIATISNTAIAFFTAIITYFVIKHPLKSKYKQSSDKVEEEKSVATKDSNNQDVRASKSCFIKENVALQQRNEMAEEEVSITI